MTQIKSRTTSPSAEAIREAKALLAPEVAAELDALVDKMDAFLEMRLTELDDELHEDIEEALKLRAENDTLTKENERLNNALKNLHVQFMKYSTDDVLQVNEALTKDNMRFRDQITKLTIDNLKLAAFASATNTSK